MWHLTKLHILYEPRSQKMCLPSAQPTEELFIRWQFCNPLRHNERSSHPPSRPSAASCTGRKSQWAQEGGLTADSEYSCWGRSQKVLVPVGYYSKWIWHLFFSGPVSIPAGPAPSPVRALPAAAPDLCCALHRGSRAALAVPWDAGRPSQPGDTALQGARSQHTPQHTPSWVQKQCTGEWLPAGRQEELPKG